MAPFVVNDQRRPSEILIEFFRVKKVICKFALHVLDDLKVTKPTPRQSAKGKKYGLRKRSNVM